MFTAHFHFLIKTILFFTSIICLQFNHITKAKNKIMLKGTFSVGEIKAHSYKVKCAFSVIYGNDIHAVNVQIYLYNTFTGTYVPR